MPSEPQSLHDVLIEHGIGLERYSTAVVRRILVIVDKAIADVEDRIRKRFRGMNVTGMDAVGSDRLKKLLDDLKRINIEAQALLRARLYGDMEAVAAAEAEFSQEAFARVMHGAGINARLGSPSAATLKSVVYSQPFQGRVLKDWAARRSAEFIDRISTQIKIGVIEGDSIDMLIERITGPGGVDKAIRRNTEAVIRTAVNHISNRTRATVAMQNVDLFEGYRWVSVLDSRTTPICRARDGKVYSFDGGPMPPAHFNCRSSVLPVLKGVTPIPFKSYSTWLKEQPREVVEDIMGPTRAKLFLDGDLKIDRFVDQTGREYTIDELRKRFNGAFERAGLGRATGKTTSGVASDPAKPTGRYPWGWGKPPEGFGTIEGPMSGLSEPSDYWQKPPRGSPLAATIRQENRRARAVTIDHGFKSGTEMLTGFDRVTGLRLAENRGIGNFVALTDEMNAAIRDPANRIVLHHNHPSSSSFSTADVFQGLFNPGLDTLYAHGHDGSIFSYNPLVKARRGVKPDDLFKSLDSFWRMSQTIVRDQKYPAPTPGAGGEGEPMDMLASSEIVVRVLEKLGFIRYHAQYSDNGLNPGSRGGYFRKAEYLRAHKERLGEVVELIYNQAMREGTPLNKSLVDLASKLTMDPNE